MNKIQNLSNLNKPFVIDGAIGSLLQEMGYKADKYLWTSYLNFKYPNVVKDIHEKYALAGADILTTNTFRTNPLVVKKSNYGIDVKLAVSKSVNLAKEITNKYNLILAGSNPPAEDCYQKERTVNINQLEYNHKTHIDLLYETGVDFILNETQSHLDELEIICKHCSNNNIPFIISLFVKEDLSILSGENVKNSLELINDYSPLAVLVNCIDIITFDNFCEKIDLDFNWGFYLNCGSGNYNNKEISCGIGPDKYSDIIKSYLHLKPKIVGTCCGSNPEHTKAIRETIDGTFNS